MVEAEDGDVAEDVVEPGAFPEDGDAAEDVVELVL